MTRVVLAILIGFGALLSVLSLVAEEPGSSTVDDTEFPTLTGPYLGQEIPGPRPVLFAPGIVSTDTREWGMASTPDGSEIFFGLFSDVTTVIVHTAFEGGRWSPIAIAEFSGEFNDYDLTMAPDGNRIYFTSTRPATPGGEEPEHVDIWYVDRSEIGWDDPVRLPEPINTPARELYPSESMDGFLYFFSSRPGGFGGFDLYNAEIGPTGFGDPTNLGPNVNTAASETDACVSPDGSYLVFTSYRTDGYGSGDLYVTFKLSDGGWSKARNLGADVNTEHREFCPSVSRDGKYLFFTSNRPRPRPISTLDGGLRRRLGVTLEDAQPDIDIYWMDASFVQQFRPAVED